MGLATSLACGSVLEIAWVKRKGRQGRRRKKGREEMRSRKRK